MCSDYLYFRSHSHSNIFILQTLHLNIYLDFKTQTIYTIKITWAALAEMKTEHFQLNFQSKNEYFSGLSLLTDTQRPRKKAAKWTHVNVNSYWTM